ncbi:hypothetical protein [Arthrobacter psychrolactophilus]|uniref:hypothetical protein n=1 Tax=Arthrobacter psychrolactophilus TaxID=92442 RepID=UPI0011B78E66|nr:hypothetical protein [Arthrobacter psychrolactophilus]
MMRTWTATLSLVCGAMALSTLTACSGGAVDPPGSKGGVASTGASIGASDVPATSAPPTTVDIRSLDLANTTWLYSLGGLEDPLEVTLADGKATIEAGEFPITHELDEVIYGDVDGDGDEDAVTRLNWAQSMGSEGLWYVWVADGVEARQVKYPLARTSRCGTAVLTPVVAQGAINLTEYERVPGLDDAIPCSEPGTRMRTRTVTIASEGTELWPVQTLPAPAWGGLCPDAKYNETTPGVGDLWAAPSKNSPVTATTSPDGGAVFELKDAPLLQREGWNPVGVKLAGMAGADGVTQLECAWAVG